MYNSGMSVALYAEIASYRTQTRDSVTGALARYGK